VKAVILLHGWGVRASVFAPLREKLACGFEVQAIALPGYDGSETCRPYDLASVASRIAAAAPERCSVVGWSLGGQVGLAWAQRAPEQVERLACIGTTPCFVQRDSWPCAMARRVLQDFASTLEVDVTRTLKRFSLLQAQGDSDSRTVVAALRSALAAPPAARVDALRGGLDILLDCDLRPSLGAVEHDALVIHGENDTLVPLAAAEYLARTLPRGKLLAVPGAGHAPFISRSEVVATALQAFFA
jgi:pimeloyl-[acyl-carrier protein] methyl ester esterase